MPWRRKRECLEVPMYNRDCTCPYGFYPCDFPNTYRCTAECELHPDNFASEEVQKIYKETPWALYCITCGEVLETRYNHDEGHVIVCTLSEYRERMAEAVLKKMKG